MSINRRKRSMISIQEKMAPIIERDQKVIDNDRTEIYSIIEDNIREISQIKNYIDFPAFYRYKFLIDFHERQWTHHVSEIHNLRNYFNEVVDTYLIRNFYFPDEEIK